MKIYIVIKDWITDYPNPITLRGGQVVMIDNSKKDDTPDWQGWVWCISNDNAGWVPEQILQIRDRTSSSISKAMVLEDYSAKEHNVAVGETVVGDRIVNGWLYCRKMDEEVFGWIPLSNLDEV
ncbi:SH3 domain-containing protein [Dysgonomonas sp. ZJ279]|uniref:SH3 domain-containing protein n=1 Tax=Dysgonomonas sp. ZJ279 TaxID=2709796 RepID=UPI0013ECF54D|nr:SH3 domain-containing protein [Dysgonomonas sp. ZJ279]